MSLDQNLFTLHFAQDEQNPQLTHLVDPSGTPHYTRRRIPSGNEYKIEVYEPLSQSLLITASAPAATGKTKILELHNPSAVVELKSTGTLSFRWSFKWEEHEFEWKREECFMVRKPDPPVLVAITKEPSGRIKTTSIQILDYNLNRFDINDRKGLEIVILTALLTFQDLSGAYHEPNAGGNTPPSLNRQPSSNTSAPPPPPKPAPKTGVERIVEMQAMRGEINEITVEDEVGASDYAEYCAQLLQDEAMLFITVKSASAEQVPKVLQVVEETKRIRHKAGLGGETALHQYVVYDTVDKPTGPKRIVLDDGAAPTNKYTPPNTLTIHLSKIDMPELRPKAGKDKDGSRKDRKEEKKPPTKSRTPPPGSRQAQRHQKPSPGSRSRSPHIASSSPLPPASPAQVTFPVPQWNGPPDGNDPNSYLHGSSVPASGAQKPASVVLGIFDSFRKR